MSELPYGPGTAAIRRFLVQLAGLGRADRDAVVERYAVQSATRGWQVAEMALATAIERSGREPLRDALSGPLLQLVRRHDAPAAQPASDEEALAALEPIAEPALAALMALLVGDLLAADQVRTLSSPFTGVISITHD